MRSRPKWLGTAVEPGCVHNVNVDVVHPMNTCVDELRVWLLVVGWVCTHTRYVYGWVLVVYVCPNHACHGTVDRGNTRMCYACMWKG